MGAAHHLISNPCTLATHFLLILIGQVIPAQFLIPTTVVAVNGSSPTARCNNAALNTCTQPSSSVLFDGALPDVTRIRPGNNNWASQMFTVLSGTTLALDFANVEGFVRLERVEVVVFNCPEWGLGVNNIAVYQGRGSSVSINFDPFSEESPSRSSCNSLTRVCLSFGNPITLPVVTLQFNRNSFSVDRIHIAEIAFYSLGFSCVGRDGIAPPRSAQDAPMVTVSAPNQPGTSSSSSGYILTAFITAIITAALTAVLFLLVLLVLRKFCPGPQTNPPPHSTYRKMDEESTPVPTENTA